jgi:hypothetical protein
MKPPRSIPKGFIVIFFALLGNFIGSVVYHYRTGKRASWLLFDYTDEQNRRTISVPVWSNFGPAFFMGLLIKPYWLVSLLVGAVLTALQGDEAQIRLLEGLAKKLNELEERKKQNVAEGEQEELVTDS